MRTLMSLKSHDMGHVELFRPPSPQMSVLDPQAAIKRDMPDFRVGPDSDMEQGGPDHLPLEVFTLTTF